MNPLPFIPKEVQGLPDHYGMKVEYLTGKTDEFELVNHSIGNDLLTFMTKQEIINWVPVSSILRVEFDKRLTKIMELKGRNDQGK